METTTKPQSISIFHNKFIETFSPETLSNINENNYERGMNLVTYGTLGSGSGLILTAIVILFFIYLNREMFSQIVKQSMLWFYLGKPNEIHAVEIPENSTANQLYDNFDILNLLQAI